MVRLNRREKGSREDLMRADNLLEQRIGRWPSWPLFVERSSKRAPRCWKKTDRSFASFLSDVFCVLFERPHAASGECTHRSNGLTDFAQLSAKFQFYSARDHLLRLSIAKPFWRSSVAIRRRNDYVVTVCSLPALENRLRS